MTIRAIMTQNVLTARESDSIKDTLLMLRKRKVSGVPVLNNAGEVVGTFSEHSVIRILPDILHDADKIPLIDIKEITSAPVSTVMRKPAVTLSPDQSIRSAAKVFLEQYVRRIPIVEETKLVGLISLGDVLKYFSNKEED